MGPRDEAEETLIEEVVKQPAECHQHHCQTGVGQHDDPPIAYPSDTHFGKASYIVKTKIKEYYPAKVAL